MEGSGQPAAPDDALPPAAEGGAAERVWSLEARIGYEWEALRRLYEIRLKELYDQGASATATGTAEQRATLEALQARLRALEARVGSEAVPGQDALLRPPAALASYRSWWLAALTVLVLGLAASVGYALWALGDVRRRAGVAAQAAFDVTQVSSREAAARAATESVASLALKRSIETEQMAEILSAPDVLRAPLQGRGRFGAARGLAYISPTNGVVLSGTGVALPRAGQEYHVWLVLDGRAQALGAAVASADGRLRGVFEPRVAALGTAWGVLVTTGPAGRALTPGDEIVLASAGA